MTIHIAMLGARQHYALPRILDRSSLLGKFYTDMYLEDQSWLKSILQSIPMEFLPPPVRRLLGRSDRELSPASVISFPSFGIWYWWKCRNATDSRALYRIYAELAQSFNNSIIQRGLPEGDVIYGFNGASLELFQYAKGRGFRCVLEQTNLPFNLMQFCLQHYFLHHQLR